MNWTRFVLAVLVAGVVSSLSDWLFMGDLLYRRFNKHPEIWRHTGGREESAAIAWSSPLPFITCAVFVLLCLKLHLYSLSQTFEVAIALWLVAPLPLLVAHALFIKLQPAIATSYAIGWLVKLIVAACAVVLIAR
jgi:hypothetical protein